MAHRIDAPGNVANKFVEPDSGTGASGTDIGAEWLTDVQENIVQAVERAGLTPVKGTDLATAGYRQLSDAIRAEAGRTSAADFKNLFVNGGFDLWRRQLVSPPSWTIGANAPTFTADRWLAQSGSSGTLIVTRADLGVAGGAQPRAGRFALQMQQSVAGPGASLEQRLEGLEQFDGLQVTLSFDAKLSSGTLNLIPYIRQNFGALGSTAVTVPGAAVPVTSTKTRFSVTFTVPSIAGKTLNGLGYMAVGLLGPAATTYTLQLSAVQVEYGAVATEFNAGDLATERLRASRYFWTTYEEGTPVGTITNVGAISCDEPGTVLEQLNRAFPVPMRTAPLLFFFSPRSGVVFKVERPFGADATVGTVIYASAQQVGAPDTPAVSSGPCRAHVVADAEP